MIVRRRDVQSGQPVIDGTKRRIRTRGIVQLWSTKERGSTAWNSPPHDMRGVAPMRPQRTTPAVPCSIDGCSKLTVARGWCDMHYRRWQRHGSPCIEEGTTSGPQSTSPICLPGERWLAIPGYEGWYEVSDLGRIRRIKPTRSRWPVPRIVSERMSTKGYAYIGLSKANSKKHFNVHRLVALAFLGPCPEGYETHHRDSNRMNARLDNLVYVSRSENNRIAAQASPIKTARGERSLLAKVTDQQVRDIRASSASCAALGRAFGLSASYVSKLKRGMDRVDA